MRQHLRREDELISAYSYRPHLEEEDIRLALAYAAAPAQDELHALRT